MASEDRGDRDEEAGGPVALVSDAERIEGATGEAAIASSAPDLIADSLGEYTRIWFRRVRSGESGVLPVVLGLIAIVVYFQVRSHLFLSAGNLVNLITQAAIIVTFGMAEVFVLLLGEIDLSVGFNAALGAVVTLWILSGSHPPPWWVGVVRRPGVLRRLRWPGGPDNHLAAAAIVRRDAWPVISAASAYSSPLSTWQHRILAAPSG